MLELQSAFEPTGPQREVVSALRDGFVSGKSRQVLLGVTGSGKTFVVANLLKELQVSALILAPNKTLAAQLFQEMKGFFPGNRVGYFISYYDYYQQEAYLPA